MAYLGKEFKFERQENFEEFIKALNLAGDDGKNYLNYKPNIKLVSNGGSYTISFLKGDGTSKDVTFTPGVEFQEAIRDFSANTVFTVDGDTFTQVQDFGSKGKITFKRTFSADKLVIEMTTSQWDGVARRFYSA